MLSALTETTGGVPHPPIVPGTIRPGDIVDLETLTLITAIFPSLTVELNILLVLIQLQDGEPRIISF